MLSKFDEHFSKDNPSAYERKLITLKILMIFLVPLVYYTSDLGVWILQTDYKSVTSVLFYVTRDIGLVYETQIAGFLWEISSILQSRYNHLQRNLEDILLKKLPRQNMSQYEFENQIITIKYKYKLLYIAVVEINVIFGWISLCFLIHLTLVFLMYFYDTIYAAQMRYQNCIQGILFPAQCVVSFLLNIRSHFTVFI